MRMKKQPRMSLLCLLLILLVLTECNGKGSNEKFDKGNSNDAAVGEEYRDNLEIAFEGVRVVLAQKKKKPDRLILDGSIAGKARPGRMLAIMGPSGSGKSTLLSAIAGTIKRNKKLSVVGKRFVNNEVLAEDSGIPAAFISQEPNFFPHMTVKETLDFRVDLKLGSKLGKSARDDVVANLLDLMGLKNSVNTMVGDAKVRGISGGEKKRLSIACEMISSPSVIFMDEPTSGLDSYQASQLVQYLRKLAESGKTVVTVIHQPSQQIFSMFDDLLLLSEGRLMFYGEIEKVRSYFAGIGYKCASDIGTAEHILDCISRTTEDQEKSDKRLDHLANEAQKLTQTISFGSCSSVEDKPLRFAPNNQGRRIVGPIKQFRLLFNRAFASEARGKTTMIIKIVQQVSLATIFGGIYRLGRNQESVMDRFGLIALLGTVVTNIGLATTVRSFPKEKTIVSSEMASGMYRTLPYLLSKAIAELPLLGAYNALFSSIIYPLAGLQEGKFGNFLALTTMHAFASNSLGLLLGAVSPDSDTALALLPPVICLNVIFDGRNISVENTPFFLRWIPRVGLIRWFFEGVAVNEFTGLTFDISGPRRGVLVKTGFDALESFGIAKRSLSEVFTAQTRIITGCWILSFVGLSLSRDKFMKMSLPKGGC